MASSSNRGLREIFSFGKPKTPGFGISRDFYLSVLAPTAVLPSIGQVLHPNGDGGAVRGYGAPLTQSKNKADLARPMERGSYACASLDRRSVLRLLVIPRDEAGFDPAAFLRSPQASLLTPDMRNRIAATWTLLQVSFEAHDPAVYPSLDFLIDLVSRMGELTGGVIADPLSQEYRLPNALRAQPPLPGPVDARNFVSVRVRDSKAGRHVHTLGMSKFALPEFELYGTNLQEEIVGSFLIGLCQTTLTAGPLQQGATIGSPNAPLEVCTGGLDRSIWEGVACYELVASRAHTVDECILAWARK